jgi:hypothetical protein
MSYYQDAEAIEEASQEATPPAPKRTRARVPAGETAAIPGSFVGDDPATPEDEAWASK